MRAKEFLTELGDAFYPFVKYTYQLNSNTDAYISEQADLIVYFVRGSCNDVNTISIEFEVDRHFFTTGEKGPEAFRILGTVKQIIKQKLPEHITADIKIVNFNSKREEESRIKLYDRAVPFISSVLGPNWDFSKGDYSGWKDYVEYKWKRIS